MRTRKTRVLSCAGVALALAVGTLLAAPARGGDEGTAGITQQRQSFVAAWNRHDPKAMAAVFAEDGDVINPWGRKANGRAEIEKLFTDEQTGKGPLRDSTMEVRSESVRTVSADVVVSDSELLVTGAYAPDGSKVPPLNIHVSDVWKKSGETWEIFSCRPYLKPAEAPGTTPPEK